MESVDKCQYENCLCKDSKLKKFTSKQDWKGRKYHSKCYNKIIKISEAVTEMSYYCEVPEKYKKYIRK